MGSCYGTRRQPHRDIVVLTPFGHYLLDEEIARGGMARVYRARLRGPGGFEKTLVVKQVRPELARDPRFVRMFVEEAKTLVQMSHPHVVAVYELGVVEGVYFLAMEHVAGVTLATLLRDGPLPPSLTAHIGAQVCDALAYAHERFGLMHRDVTPRNIMIEPTGHVRLLDFGIAAPTEGAGGGEVFGSPGYMSPEQAQGLALDERTDLFSLGAVLYECLTGRRAFEGHSAREARQALLNGPPAPLDPEALPAELRDTVETLLASRVEDRPASAADVGRRLRAWLAGRAPEGVAPEMGRRVDAARRRASDGSDPHDAQHPAPPSGGDGTVETLATSTALAEWLGTDASDDDGAGTMPIPGRSASPDPPARASIVILTISLAVLVASTLAPLLMDVDPAAAPQPPVPEDAPAPVDEPASSDGADPPDPAEPTPADPPNAPAPTGEATPPPAAPSRARLTVNAVPWAEIHLDGRSLGTTPLRDERIPAGRHRLELACPPLGRTAHAQVEVTGGSSIRVLADLTTDPPTVTMER